jgi:RNA polymerase sigma-70 factor (ECF subfamily)
LTETSDTELMIRVREGDVGELARLFQRHSGRLLNYFLKMTGDRALSEDLVQEVYIRMLKYRKRFEARGSGFAPWMFRLAHNVGMDHFRKRRPEQTAETEAWNLASQDPSPAAALEEKESHRLLHQALRALPPRRREALVLSRFEHKKYKEIAEIVGCSVGAVKLRVHRAMLELRESYSNLLKEASHEV